MAIGVNATTIPARPSHEEIESTGGNAAGLTETPEEHIDEAAMEMAKRAENRLKDDDKAQIPGDSIFTK